MLYLGTIKKRDRVMEEEHMILPFDDLDSINQEVKELSKLTGCQDTNFWTQELDNVRKQNEYLCRRGFYKCIYGYGS